MKLRAEVTAVIVPCAFGLIPIAGMILASYPVLVPPAVSVARIVFAVTCVLVVSYAALRRWLTPTVAADALGVGVLLCGMYPFANSMVGRSLPVSEFHFACAYLALCLAAACVPPWLSGNTRQHIFDVLRVIAAVFAICSVGLIAWVYGLRQPYDAGTAAVVNQLSAELPVPDSVPRRPDVFHLVLDGMGRPDVLSERFGMRLDGLIAQFRKVGFHIDPSLGYANYVQTHLSIPSMLNVTYLDALADRDRSTANEEPLRALISEARVPNVFKRLGYEVEFIGGGSLAEGAFDEADHCDCPQLWFFDPEVGAISLTPFKVLMNLGFGHKAHFNRSLAVFEAFERQRIGSNPRYVYAHVMLPHPPFVVDEQGAFLNPRRPLSGADASWYLGSPDEYRQSYRAQATFALKRTLAATTRVVENARKADREVIVIITGDHGPRFGLEASQPTADSGRFALPVWLALRWPGDLATGDLPKSLVNVYRIVFERVFRMDLPPLPDRAFLSAFGKPYVFIPVKLGPDNPAPATKRTH